MLAVRPWEKQINMILWMLIMTLPLALATAANELTVMCSDDLQCASGFFCRTDDHHCRECLRCEDLHRQPPPGLASCVRLFSECGACLKGYEYDHTGSGCTAESAAAEAWYLWLLVALVIACLLVCAIGVVVYAMRNTDTFRVSASTNTSVEAPAGKAVSPSAPQPTQPPPYNYGAPYEPVRPSSPETNAPAASYGRGDYVYPTPDSDAERPLVKRTGKGATDGRARESAGSQNARVYSNPAYVRNVPPPSYDSALSDDSDHEQGPFQPVDEETMPSDWTPAVPAPHTESSAAAAGAGVAASGAASSAGALARRPARDPPASPPPAKIRCQEDSNNNHSGGSSGSGQPPSPPRPAPPPEPHVVINVLNVNAVHQRNDVMR